MSIQLDTLVPLSQTPSMPNIDTVKGVKMNIYPNDHVPPHIHAIFGEHEALIEIITQNIFIGFLPKTQLRIAIQFVAGNMAELLEIFYRLNPKTKLL